MKKVFFYIISILDYIISKNNNKIVYTSFPDFSDNSFAMFVYMSNNHPEYQTVWLVDKIEKVDLYKKMTLNYTKNDMYKIIEKNSLIGIYHYLTSKYVFFSHGLYTGVSIPKNHIVVNLWHGMPLKSIAYLDSEFKGIVQKAKYIISTSSAYQEILAKAFRVNKNSVLVTGQPRNDLLITNTGGILHKFGIKDNYKNIFMWMPTYRRSIFGDIRVDGNETESLPIMSIKDLDDLNLELKEANYFMFIKLHPMDVLTLKKFNAYTNISIIKNDDFEEKGIQLYTLLGSIDVLLTDYSSVYIDFLLTGKPIAFVMEDMEMFANSRGFVFDNPIDYMPGELITNKEDFFKFLKRPNNHSQYNSVTRKLNSVLENSSENIFIKVIDK